MLHPGANFAPSSGEVDLAGYTHLLLQNEIPLDDTLAYLRAAGKAGIKSVYNPSPMPSREVLAAFPWDCLSYLIVNEGELSDILSAFDDTPLDAKLSVKDRAIAQMHALHGAKGFAKSVAIVTTIGPEGVLVLDVKGPHPEVAYSPAAKARKVVDTTGAGDTFAGYFVAMLMDKGDDAPIAELIPTCLQVSGARDAEPMDHAGAGLLRLRPAPVSERCRASRRHDRARRPAVVRDRAAQRILHDLGHC